MKLWEGLSQDLNYNVMFSQRGVLNLGHSLQDMRDIERRVNANRLNGVDGEVLDAAAGEGDGADHQHLADARYPILGASLQRRAGVARHDAVAWGFARGAERAASTSSRTARSPASISGTAAQGSAKPAGASSAQNGSASSRPVTRVCSRRWPACACRSRAIRCRRSCPSRSSRCSHTVVMSNAVHGYISQSDKGDLVIGAGIDAYTGYGQRGSFRSSRARSRRSSSSFRSSAACG